MTDAWSRYEELGAEPRDTLTEVERDVFAICDMRQEVNAGGFDSYFRSWGGATAVGALEALPGVLSQPWAELLGEAIALLVPEYPTDADERSDLLDDAELDEQLQELDDRFYALEESIDADEKLSSYLENGARPDEYLPEPFHVRCTTAQVPAEVSKTTSSQRSHFARAHKFRPWRGWPRPIS